MLEQSQSQVKKNDQKQNELLTQGHGKSRIGRNSEAYHVCPAV